MFSEALQLMKVDGFNIKSFLGASMFSVVDRLKNAGTYLKMPTSKMGFIVTYGFAAISVGMVIESFTAEVPIK